MIKTLSSVTLSIGLLLSLFAVLPSTSTALAQIGPYPNPDYDRVEKYRLSGISARADWFIEDEEEESFTEVSVYLVDSALSGDERYAHSLLYVSIQQYTLVEDECYWDQEEEEEYCDYDFDRTIGFDGFAELDKSDFKISNNLRSALVRPVEVEGYDWVSDNEMTILVSAEWMGQGSKFKDTQMYSQTNEFYKAVAKVSGTARDALAKAQITGDGIDLSVGYNEEYHYASLMKSREGYMFRILSEPY